MAYFSGATPASDDTEKLRRDLLNEIYAGAFAGGFHGMLLDEDAVRKAGPDELKKIAQRYGFR